MSRLAVPVNLDFNEQFELAFHTMEYTGRNVFITGKAGTGKSTLLQFFRANTKKQIVVLAPTGVAAVNVRGQTIHSFFGFKPDVTPESAASLKPRSKKLYKNIDALVIDEISMVRADLLDCIDLFLRKHGKKKKQPFGGTQMIFIGDLYQLPPVVTGREREIFSSHYKSPYFFDAKVFSSPDSATMPIHRFTDAPIFTMDFIELEKVYRQTDAEFIRLLNTIRNNSATESDLAAINKRVDDGFAENEDDFYIHLTTTNAMADEINHEKLKLVRGKPRHYTGMLDGEFQPKDLPTHHQLTIKPGAQVMLLNNDAEGRWVNGSIGRIVDIEYDDGAGRDVIGVELADGDIVPVNPYTWQMFRFSFDEETKTLNADPVGSFTQYPLKLAWAVTIHKSQGKTFERVIIDIGHGAFTHGQVYVALSRCTSLEGIVLKRPIQKNHVLMDWRVVRFVTEYQYALSEKICSLDEKTNIIREAVRSKQPLEIVYLKSSDEKSRRTVVPVYVGEMEYQGKKYIGMRAFCNERKSERTFRVDRILEIKNDRL